MFEHLTERVDRAATATDSFVVRSVRGKGRGVFATRSWRPCELVISARITAMSPRRTVYSFQTGHDFHCEFDEPARLINHSCAPNLGIADNTAGAFDFLALLPINVGDELTWDYASSEYHSIAVPVCHCGAPTCRGTVTGYAGLNPTQRSNLTHTASYLTRPVPPIPTRDPSTRCTGPDEGVTEAERARQAPDNPLGRSAAIRVSPASLPPIRECR
ncbi:SET domain-containing protein-lysine N-methyltransferase [Nocardia salmonicida]